MAYLEDILVASKSKEAHKRALDEVFQRLNNYGARVGIQKCKFFQKQVKYLGFIVDKDEIRPDPEKVAAIQKMTAPPDVKQL